MVGANELTIIITSAPIGNYERPAVGTDRLTDGPTDRRTGGVIGKLHFQVKLLGRESK